MCEQARPFTGTIHVGRGHYKTTIFRSLYFGHEATLRISFSLGRHTFSPLQRLGAHTPGTISTILRDGGKPMGRRKIEIAPIQNERHRQVTFAKRKLGVIRKATELAVLCGTDVALIITGPNKKTCVYSSGDVSELVNRYLECKDVAEVVTTEQYFRERAAQAGADSDDEDGEAGGVPGVTAQAWPVAASSCSADGTVTVQAYPAGSFAGMPHAFPAHYSNNMATIQASAMGQPMPAASQEQMQEQMQEQLLQQQEQLQQQLQMGQIQQMREQIQQQQQLLGQFQHMPPQQAQEMLQQMQEQAGMPQQSHPDQFADASGGADAQQLHNQLLMLQEQQGFLQQQIEAFQRPAQEQPHQEQEPHQYQDQEHEPQQYEPQQYEPSPQ